MSRKKVFFPFIFSFLIIYAVYFFMSLYQTKIFTYAHAPSFVEIISLTTSHSLFYRFLYFLANMTEGYFFNDVFSSIGLVGFAFIVFFLEKKEKYLFQQATLGGKGIFLPVFFSSVIALLLSNLLYFDLSQGWIPSFSPFVSTAPALVMVFGISAKKIITSGTLAGIVTFPFANLFYRNFALRFQLPGFCGVAIGMSLATLFCIELCYFLPWMKKEEINSLHIQFSSPTPWQFFTRRILQDPGEIVFWGSPLSTLGMLFGLLISFLLNPMTALYGSGKLPVFLFAFFGTLAFSIFWYAKLYEQEGFVFTFGSAVCSAGVILTYQTTAAIVLSTMFYSAIVVPYVIFLLLKLKITTRWHPCVVALFCIGITCSLWSLIVMHGFNGLQ